jgi:hypothetical protein
MPNLLIGEFDGSPPEDVLFYMVSGVGVVPTGLELCFTSGGNA